MNENLGINMSSYLEWNILLVVLALFGNFPYGPPLSPNGIWDSFVSLLSQSRTSTTQGCLHQRKIPVWGVYTVVFVVTEGQETKVWQSLTCA